MTNMRKLATSIIAIANEKSYGIDWWKLNLVLYFTIVDGIKYKVIDKDYLSKLYDEKFENRDYPILPSVYNEYKWYGPTFIIENAEFDEEFSNLKNVIVNLLEVSTVDLWLEASKSQIYNKEKQLYEIEDLFNI